MQMRRVCWNMTIERITVANNRYDIIIGIDVGKSGGIVALDGKDGSVIGITKTPETIQDHLDMLSQYTGENAIAVVEKVGGHYGDAAFSAFNFGFTCAIMHTALTFCKIPFDLVSPKTWQKFYGMSKYKGETGTSWKNRLKSTAQEMHPNTKMTLWGSDAVLIGNYYYQTNK